MNSHDSRARVRGLTVQMYALCALVDDYRIMDIIKWRVCKLVNLLIHQLKLHCSAFGGNSINKKGKAGRRRSCVKDFSGGGFDGSAPPSALSSRDGDAFGAHVQMFNPLAGTEAAGNATLTPHPVTSHRSITELMFVKALEEPPVSAGYMRSPSAHTGKCAQHTHTHR